MTGFNHTLVGISIAAAVLQPVLAPLLAFASHFVLDALPHFGQARWLPTWSKRFIWMLVIDAVLCFGALALGIILFPDIWWLVALCAFAATLPDFLWNLQKFAPKHWFFRFHTRIQWGERPWGLWIELPFGLMMVGLLFYLHNIGG